MISLPDSTAVGAREALTSYEELRRSALGPAGGSGRGIALFLRCGMAAWIETCAALPRPPEPRPRRSAVEEQPLVPQDLRVEVATLLAEMALSAHAQGAKTP